MTHALINLPGAQAFPVALPATPVQIWAMVARVARGSSVDTSVRKRDAWSFNQRHGEWGHYPCFGGGSEGRRGPPIPEAHGRRGLPEPFGRPMQYVQCAMPSFGSMHINGFTHQVRFCWAFTRGCCGRSGYAPLDGPTAGRHPASCQLARQCCSTLMEREGGCHSIERQVP